MTGDSPDPEEGKTAHDGEQNRKGGSLLRRGENLETTDILTNDVDFGSSLLMVLLRTYSVHTSCPQRLLVMIPAG